MKSATFQTRHLATFFAMIGLLLAGMGTGMAQDATPSAGSHPSHPAHIHSGTCTELGDVVFPLADLAAPGAMGTPEATPADMGMAGHDMGTPMAGEDMTEGTAETSVTDVDASLDDILAAEHAINVHESADNIGNYIACGDITGEPEDGELTIELEELNDSGHSGEAVLVDNGDGTTTVTVTLTSGASGAGATPSASGSADEMGTYEVLIVDFAYSPAELTIKVGESVTFTNQDSAPHTATAQDRDVLQTGTLNQGESATITFDTPGTYEYFCEFHPDMSGVIIVE